MADEAVAISEQQRLDEMDQQNPDLVAPEDEIVGEEISAQHELVAVPEGRHSPSCFTGFSFLTTLVATRRCRCLLRSARVNVMPEQLLFVISGILAGGIPGFRIELCCFLHPLTWPLVFFCGLFVLLLVRGHSHNDTQDVIMHEFPLLAATPHLCVVFVLVWLWLCFLFVCLFSVVFGLVFVCLVSCWDCSLDCVQVHYQHFCGFRRVDSRACKLQFICLPRLNVCNDLAEAMKALDGKKSSA